MDNKLEQLAQRIQGLLEQEATLADLLSPDYTVSKVKYDGYDAEFEITQPSTGRLFRVVIDEIEG